MKRTIYDCWNCRHHNNGNPYGIDYCNVHGIRCSFAHDDCDNFEPAIGSGNHPEPGTGNDSHKKQSCRLTVAEWYLLTIAIVALLAWLLTGCTTTKYVPVTETRTEHHWHTDSVRECDSTLIERETVIRELDSAAMARYGIQMERNQLAWLVLQREMENRLRELDHITTQRDTVRDSIPVPYPVEVVKEVPRERSTVEWALLIIGFLAIVWICFRTIIKIKHV